MSILSGKLASICRSDSADESSALLTFPRSASPQPAGQEEEASLSQNYCRPKWSGSNTLAEPKKRDRSKASERKVELLLAQSLQHRGESVQVSRHLKDITNRIQSNMYTRSVFMKKIESLLGSQSQQFEDCLKQHLGALDVGGAINANLEHRLLKLDSMSQAMLAQLSAIGHDVQRLSSCIVDLQPDFLDESFLGSDDWAGAVKQSHAETESTLATEQEHDASKSQKRFLI